MAVGKIGKMEKIIFLGILWRQAFLSLCLSPFYPVEKNNFLPEIFCRQMSFCLDV